MTNLKTAVFVSFLGCIVLPACGKKDKNSSTPVKQQEHIIGEWKKNLLPPVSGIGTPSFASIPIVQSVKIENDKFTQPLFARQKRVFPLPFK